MIPTEALTRLGEARPFRAAIVSTLTTVPNWFLVDQVVLFERGPDAYAWFAVAWNPNEGGMVFPSDVERTYPVDLEGATAAGRDVTLPLSFGGFLILEPRDPELDPEHEMKVANAWMEHRKTLQVVFGLDEARKIAVGDSKVLAASS